MVCYLIMRHPAFTPYTFSYVGDLFQNETERSKKMDSKYFSSSSEWRLINELTLSFQWKHTPENLHAKYDKYKTHTPSVNIIRVPIGRGFIENQTSFRSGNSLLYPKTIPSFLFDRPIFVPSCWSQGLHDIIIIMTQIKRRLSSHPSVQLTYLGILLRFGYRSCTPIFFLLLSSCSSTLELWFVEGFVLSTSNNILLVCFLFREWQKWIQSRNIF